MRLALIMLAARAAFGDAGVLIPADRKEPDPKLLSLAEMHASVRIDNGDARVSVRQIFRNHRGVVTEGNYVFALPGKALVSDFAVWDDVTRIPGVILERRRAEEIYSDLRWQAIDPGLLQMGERGADEARRGAAFTARVAPILPYGTKRLEIEYHEPLAVEELRSFFALPLRPTAYRAQAAGRFTLQFELRSSLPLADFRQAGALYPLRIEERTANVVRGVFEGTNVAFGEDFAVEYAVDGAKGPRLEVLAHRAPGENGFFQSSLLLPPAPAGTEGPVRTVVALFDASLSMQWEKLERCFQALEALLRSLSPSARFQLLLYNTDVTAFSPAAVAAKPAQVDKALEFVRGSRLRGGTDLQAALGGLSFAAPGSYLVLLGDGGATRGLVHNGRLAAWYEERWNALEAERRPRTYVFAVGDDANMPLVKALARQGGVAEWVRSTEPIDFKLNAFLAKIGKRPVEGLSLSAQPVSNFDFVYPLQESSFPGSVAAWVGQYRQPGKAEFQAGGQRAAVNLPAQSGAHPHLPRAWAKARVDALLEKIDREGEDETSVGEIIRLSRKYKFVTPYTSFLAAPRALLRPRLIRPGDPVLRVKCDPSVVSVVALFPFGLVKPLRRLEAEDVWQTRFLAPKDMADGAHRVKLLLRDKAGRVFRESKTFVIASKPPLVQVKLEKTAFRRGETMRLRVAASETTRTIVARMQGAPPARIYWNARMNANTGEMTVPAHLAAGRYKLTVQAEDFAHNIGSQETVIEVLP